MIDRRQIVASPLALVLGPFASAARAQSAPPELPGATLSLTATSDRAISYRNQQHMWQTDDGRTHLLLNRGFQAPGAALALHVSNDNGRNWALGPALSETDYSSTSDAFLSGSTLFAAYSTTAGAVRSVQFAYNAASGTWTRGNAQGVFPRVEGQRAYTPALTSDAGGTRWCCATLQDQATLEVVLRVAYRRPGSGSAWVDTGLDFGERHTEPADGGTRSAGRPIRVSGGIGMLYTLRGQIWWAERRDGWAPSRPWTTTLVHEAPPSDAMVRGKYGGHYSFLSDTDGNLHLATVEDGRGLYLRRLAATGAWDAPREILGTPVAAFTQVTLCGDTLLLIVSTGTESKVFQSLDSGDTFRNTHVLTHPPAPPDGSVDYGSPRQESPGRSADPVPVLQQFTTGRVQRFLHYEVPVSRP